MADANPRPDLPASLAFQLPALEPVAVPIDAEHLDRATISADVAFRIGQSAFAAGVAHRLAQEVLPGRLRVVLWATKPGNVKVRYCR